jgi:hypothetical protein
MIQVYAMPPVLQLPGLRLVPRTRRIRLVAESREKGSRQLSYDEAMTCAFSACTACACVIRPPDAAFLAVDSGMFGVMNPLRSLIDAEAVQNPGVEPRLDLLSFVFSGNAEAWARLFRCHDNSDLQRSEPREMQKGIAQSATDETISGSAAAARNASHPLGRDRRI